MKSFTEPNGKKMQGLLKRIRKSTLARQKSSPSTPDDKSISSPVVKLPTTPVESEEEKLLRCQKDIKSALQYYKVIFRKGFLQKLPGTATVVLESIVCIETIFSSCLHFSKLANENLDDLTPTRETLHRNVTDLIRLSDDVLFDASSNYHPDETVAFHAVDSVLNSLNDLCEAILPRIQKLQVNEELKTLYKSSSAHSSSNSINDVLEEEGNSGRKSRRSSSNSNQFAVGSSSTSASKLDVERPKGYERDSGISSEMSVSSGLRTDSSEGRPESTPAPAKPPLPRTGDRSFYGNQPFPGQSIRKTNSHPVNLEAQMSPVHLKPRPNSDVRTNTAHGQFLEVSRKFVSTSTSISSLNSSKSSVSSMEESSTTSLSRKYLHRMHNKSEYSLNSTYSQGDQIDLEEVGMSDETFSQIQKYSEKYEVLMGSTMSLFSNEDESIFSSPTPDEKSPLGGLPPVPPKQRNKQPRSNYLKYFDIHKYGKPSKGDRPTSYYDNVNCPVPSAYDIDGEQLLREFSSQEEPPKLPPKKSQSVKEPRVNTPGNKNSPKLRHERLSTRSFKAETRSSHREERKRDSYASYEEDNVPALDCIDPSKFLIFKEDRNRPLLVGGTVDSLIVYAVSAEEKNAVFYEAFVATYRTFTSPLDLICKLLYRSNRFRDKGTLHITQGALLLLIRIVDEMYEELDKSLFDQLRAEVHRLINLGELEIAKHLRDKIVNYCLKLQAKLSPKVVVSSETSKKYSLLDFHSLELAQHMTFLDSDLFLKIGLPEILAWGKEQNEQVSPNLAEFIDHFNRMSFWVRTVIMKEPKQQEREKLFKKYLKIMKHLRRLNNFSSYLAILSALDSSPLRRLEFPKPLTDILEEYCQMIDSTAAFKTYRQALSEAKPPCIPYLGLILQDITFIHLGNPSELPDGKVNFVKRWQQYNVLDTVRRFKECQYELTKNEKILEFFDGYEDHLSEEELWDKSQEIKPRAGRKL